jgi:hypothetical protein
MRRRWVVALLPPLLLASGCGTTVQGTAAENPKAVADLMFPAANRAVRDNLVDHSDGRYTDYVYAKVGDSQLGTESEVSLLGDNPSLLEVRQSRLDAALKVTIYHPAASSNDLLKLDGKFTTLAPTPWVSYPTYFPSKSTVTCSYPALTVLCTVDRARQDTEKASPPNLPHDARVLPDGSAELHSGATLKSLLDNKVLVLDDQLSKSITPEMMQSILPVRILLDADRALRSVEVNGQVPGKPNSLLIQIGFERHGPASQSDFPATPKPEEVTVIPDEQGRSQLWQRIHS